MPGDPLGRKRAYVALSRRNTNALQALGLAPGPNTRRTPVRSRACCRRTAKDATLDVQLVPVSIFVGRAPDKHSGWFSVLFSENWTIVGRFRACSRSCSTGVRRPVQFAPPVSVRASVDEGLEPQRTVRKLSRVLRAHFRRIRAADHRPGPVHAPPARRPGALRRFGEGGHRRPGAPREGLESRKGPGRSVEEGARLHLRNRRDYSHPVVRSVSFMLTTVWNRIYRGVLVHHLDTLKQNAPGHEVVYVPCHRSHMDYLLLSYLLYTKGIVPPHIAPASTSTCR
jgi:glycerol-3-phosphate O-acyltransferase